MDEQKNAYAVVDVETTGFGKTDRVIEIAVVTLDDRFRVLDEFETLVNPDRDLGPTHVHGIKPSMISMAPSFSEIAAALSQRIQNRTLVSHNIAFESRMLCREFDRLGASLDCGRGICTLRLTGEKLPRACENHNIAPPKHHRALSDARAAAKLLQALEHDEWVSPISIRNLSEELSLRTHRRCADEGGTVLDRLMSRATYEGIDSDLLAYVDLLDWVLDDLVITGDERQHLNYLAEELNLSPREVAKAHQDYFWGTVKGAKRDGVITGEERLALAAVAKSLDLPSEWVPAITDVNDQSSHIPTGSAICFTGSYVDESGKALSKQDLQDLAKDAGFKVVASVTKSKCDFLVAVDSNSCSGKAKQARKYGKPIIPAARFLELV